MEGARSSASASETAREDVAKKLADCQVELAHLEKQHAQLVETNEQWGQEIDRLRGQRKMQCDVFWEVYNRIFAIGGKLGMTVVGSSNFQADDVGSYALSFQGFVTKLEEVAKDFQQTIDDEALEVATLAVECAFTNLHLIDATFPFTELVKLPERGKKAEASRAATTDHVEELVNVFIRDEDEGLEDPARATDLPGEDTDPEVEA